MGGLQGKVILITGGTSGLGEAAAVRAASDGATVVVTGRREAQGAAVVDRIKAAGGDGMFIRTDVTVTADLQAMVAETMARYGRLDGAVNNAGTAGSPMTPMADITEDAWHFMLNTNLHSVFLGMKYQIPAMLAGGGGAIVNISSMYGLIGGDLGNADYVTSKWGVIGLTKSAAIDYGDKGIRVNAVCPGFCHSEMVDPYIDSAPEMMERSINRHSAMNRVGESSEIADVIAWLLSDQSSFVNGAEIRADGGETTRLY